MSRQTTTTRFLPVPSLWIVSALLLCPVVAGSPATALADTPILVDINPAGSSYPTWLENIGGTLYFQANNGTVGVEPWRSDGTPAGTTLVRDVLVGSQGSYPSAFTGHGSDVLFAANNGVTGFELWRSDGTEMNTVLLRDINPGAADSWPGVGIPFTASGDAIYFMAYTNANGYELWRSDGTSAGTALVKDINPGVEGSSPLDLTDVSGTLLFRADDGLPATNHRELWRSDGSEGGTEIVEDINPAGEGYPSNPVVLDGILYFSADDGVNGRELWRSDGTESGTQIVADIRPGGSSLPGQLRILNATIYFVANDGTHGAELWRSDGTEEGTNLVVDLNPSGNSPITYLTVVGDALFFVLPSGPLSAQLWTSDGTAVGTFQVASFGPANEYPIIENLTDVEGTLFFSANDGVHGIELWRSDGTPEGTVMAADINVGDEWSFSYPDELTNVAGALFFAADDGVNGRELWVLENPAATGVGGAGSVALPMLELHPNYPNPFARSTTLRFDLAGPALVRVSLLDVAGRKVRDLVPASWLEAGPHVVSWDGRDDEGRLLGSGVYVYRVVAGVTSEAGRVVLAR